MNDFHPSWATLPLAQLASEICLGKMLDKEKNRGTLRPYLRNVNVRWFGFDLDDMKEMRFEQNESERFGLRPGDLVVCEGGEPGRAAVWSGQSASVLIQKALHRIRFNEDHFNPHFAAYYLYFGRLANRFSDLYTGTTISHLTGKAIRRIVFPLPPLNEQRRIVAKLDEQFSDLDVATATLQRVKAKLKRYRASVLKAAIDGKLTAEWRRSHPETEPAAALLERILVERRSRWEDAQRVRYAAAEKSPPANWRNKYPAPKSPETDQLPRLPVSWCWTTLDALADVCGGITKGQQRDKGQQVRSVPYLRVANVQRGYLDLSEIKQIEATESEISDLRLEPGDILFNEGGDRDKLGRGWVWQGQIDECIHQNHVFRARLVSADVLPEFVSHHGNEFGRLWFMKAGKQSVNLASINLSVLKRFPVPLAPVAEQGQILQEVSARLSVVEQIMAQVDANLKRAERLKQGILKRAFEGKLVPQVATDEPAAVLLERIRQQRLAAPQKPPKKPAGGKLVRAILENMGRAIAYCLSRAKKPHGRTWLAKVLALGELHVGAPFQQRLTRQKFGPLDEAIYKAERVARKAGWFDFIEPTKAKEQTSYHATAGTPAAAAAGAEFLGERQAAFDRLLADFDDLDTDNAELFATAYAAWNDLLLDGRPADEDAIVAEFYAWDESKAKFGRDQILTRIAWMRQHGYVPAGRGRRTAVVEKKPKSPSSRTKRPRKA